MSGERCSGTVDCLLPTAYGWEIVNFMLNKRPFLFQRGKGGASVGLDLLEHVSGPGGGTGRKRQQSRTPSDLLTTLEVVKTAGILKLRRYE